MELIKIISARRTLEELFEKEDICAHLSYWMTKFVAKTEGEHAFYASEMRKLFDKYAVECESDDGSVLIPNENVAVFNAAVDELNKTDVEDPGIRFNLSELSAELRLSMKQMYTLLDFINEDK